MFQIDLWAPVHGKLWEVAVSCGPSLHSVLILFYCFLRATTLCVDSRLLLQPLICWARSTSRWTRARTSTSLPVGNGWRPTWSRTTSPWSGWRTTSGRICRTKSKVLSSRKMPVLHQIPDSPNTLRFLILSHHIRFQNRPGAVCSIFLRQLRYVSGVKELSNSDCGLCVSWCTCPSKS